jgi:hypothetical protein
MRMCGEGRQLSALTQHPEEQPQDQKFGRDEHGRPEERSTNPGMSGIQQSLDRHSHRKAVFQKTQAGGVQSGGRVILTCHPKERSTTGRIHQLPVPLHRALVL